LIDSSLWLRHEKGEIKMSIKANAGARRIGKKEKAARAANVGKSTHATPESGARKKK
jgi:hypothetical protein